MAEDFLEDLDILDPPKKLVKIAGETIDVSFIPSRVTIEATRISTAFDKKQISVDEMFERMVGIIVKIGSKSNPKITSDWVLDNLSIQKVTKLMEVIVSDTGESKKEDDTGKN